MRKPKQVKELTKTNLKTKCSHNSAWMKLTTNFHNIISIHNPNKTIGKTWDWAIV